MSVSDELHLHLDERTVGKNKKPMLSMTSQDNLARKMSTKIEGYTCQRVKRTWIFFHHRNLHIHVLWI